MTRILFVGDVMLSRSIGTRLASDSLHKIISDDVTSILTSADFCVANLESPVSQNALVIKKNGFRASPNSLNQIKNFHLLSLANNHIFDCDTLGVEDTIFYLEQNNYLWAGINPSDNRSINPVSVKLGCEFFYFYSCLSDEYVSKNVVGRLKVINAADRQLRRSISKTSEKDGTIIVLVHGGNEKIPYPQPSFRRLCESYVDAGADVVITTHPHVFGGYQNYKGKLIFYSLGDFIFDSTSNLRNRGAILQLEIEKKIRFKIIPVAINSNHNVVLAEDKKKKAVQQKFQRITKALRKKNYDSLYTYFYIKSFISFQADRLLYLFKNQGLSGALRFFFKNILNIGKYIKKITNKRHL